MTLDSAAAAGVQRQLSVSLLLPLLVVIYALVAFAVAPSTFARLLQSYAEQLTILGDVLLVALPLAALVLRPRAPLSFLGDIARRAGPRFLLTILTFWVGLAAFTTFKINIPNLVPFYADRSFADADALLHGGDPGLFLHAVVPGWAAELFAPAYNVIWFYAWFGLIGFVTLQRSAELRRRYFWTMATTFALLGTVLATALSSVGPIFYDHFMASGRFEDLMAAVYAGGAGPGTLKTADYLLAAFEGGGDITGTGISAMPSMHVAVVTLNAWMLTSVGRTLGALGWLYAALIMVASVYLGWHYAIDGYLSAIAVSLLWWIIGKATRRIRRLAP